MISKGNNFHTLPIQVIRKTKYKNKEMSFILFFPIIEKKVKTAITAQLKTEKHKINKKN